MKTIRKSSEVSGVFLRAGVVLWALAASAAGADDALLIAEGGRLYDKWWAEYGLTPPESIHPAYPASGKQKGAATWRCKECHGWDYMGRDGAYGRGSHYTGIVGIRKHAGGSVEEVVGILKDPNHGYQEVMLDGALEVLANFVVNGQIDMDAHIDRASGKAKGDKRAGQVIFEEYCVRCHGEDGRTLNFKPQAKEYVGTVAGKNPWEALHKIRNGHPGATMGPRQMHGSMELMRRHHQRQVGMPESMPSMLGKLSVEQQMALLAYLQTLPTD